MAGQGIYPRTELAKQHMSAAAKKRIRKPHTEVTKEKLRQIRLANPVTPNLGKFGPDSSYWKGEDVSYSGIHAWVRRRLGTPKDCSNCKKHVEGQGIHWANVSREYKRDLTDWIRLCSKCHYLYDNSLIELRTGL